MEAVAPSKPASSTKSHKSSSFPQTVPETEADAVESQVLEDTPPLVSCFGCKESIRESWTQRCDGFRCKRKYCPRCVSTAKGTFACETCLSWFCTRCAPEQKPKDSSTTEDTAHCWVCRIKTTRTPVKTTPGNSSDPVCPGAPKKPAPAGGLRATGDAHGSRKRLFKDTNEEAPVENHSPAAAEKEKEDEDEEEVSASHEAAEDLAHLSTQELDQKAAELETVLKEAKEGTDENDRKRVRHEDELDSDPPLTQRYFISSRFGPTRVPTARRLQLEITNESWRVIHGSDSEQAYTRPSLELASKYKTSDLIVMERCRICNEHGANTVIANCGHAIYCIGCAASKLPLKCHTCETSISRIIPILNPTLYQK